VETVTAIVPKNHLPKLVRQKTASRISIHANKGVTKGSRSKNKKAPRQLWKLDPVWLGLLEHLKIVFLAIRLRILAELVLMKVGSEEKVKAKSELAVGRRRLQMQEAAACCPLTRQVELGMLSRG
jgi:hypothetical protein